MMGKTGIGRNMDYAAYLPFIGILGPIIGAFIGAAVTLRFVVKRKRVTFYVTARKD